MSTVRDVTRKSLPLSARDVADIARLSESPEQRAALEALTGLPATGSIAEARVLHGLLEAALRAVREQVEERGYAEIAAQANQAEQQSLARRRRPSWAEEA